MEIIKRLIARFWPTVTLFIGILLLIIYVGFGILYLQQGAQQRELEEQIVQLGAVVTKPLLGGEELQAEYEEAGRALAPMTDSAAIALLVSIAQENGIDVHSDTGKFRVPTATFSKKIVGGGNYQVLFSNNIHVQGDHDDVMAFISDIDSGKTLKTMVLTSVITRQIEVGVSVEEAARKAEFRTVASAVTSMMTDNELSELPNPVSTTPTNDMGVFPDASVCGIDKIDDTDGNAYINGLDKNGYLLYQHDITADGDNTTDLVNYVITQITEYYYTCEADGTVHQFDGANRVTATEYLLGEEAEFETEAKVSVDIYTKLEE